MKSIEVSSEKPATAQARPGRPAEAGDPATLPSAPRQALARRMPFLPQVPPSTSSFAFHPHAGERPRLAAEQEQGRADRGEECEVEAAERNRPFGFEAAASRANRTQTAVLPAAGLLVAP